MSVMASFDWIVIALYFTAVFGIAFYVTRQESKTRETSAGYFLAGRNVGWFVIGASLFASNIGSEHLVGLAGTGFSSGVAVAQFEILASIILLILGWFFVPFYIRSSVYTMPEFLERRYSVGARYYLAGISILSYVLTKIAVTVAAGGIVFEALLGWNFWVGALIVIVGTGIYTIFGGLRAVIYTDLMQMFVLIAGSIAVTVFGLMHIGGWGELKAAAGPDFFNMWKSMDHPEFPWTGVIFGAPILGIWYWCTDQFIVQRVLSAKDIDNARRGSLFGGVLKVLPLFIFVIPGIIAYVMSQNGDLVVAEADQALPALIGAILPVGLRGLVVAGLLAALMSSLSSVFNSSSTLITLDIYKKIRPETSERNLVWVGQLSTVFLVILGLLWIPYMQNMGDLFIYLQKVQAYVSPPIAAVFLLGIFLPRLNSRGALVALWSGFAVGMLRLVAEVYKADLTGALADFAAINFLHFAVFLFLFCSAVLVIASLTASAPKAEKTDKITWKRGEAASGDSAWRRTDVMISVFLVAAVAAVWMYFTG